MFRLSVSIKQRRKSSQEGGGKL